MSNTMISPNTPKKLARAFLKAKTYRALERQLGVDHHYIGELIQHGIEPNNPEIRVRLFLPRRKREPHTPKPDTRPAWLRTVQKNIRAMRTATTRAILKQWKHRS